MWHNNGSFPVNESNENAYKTCVSPETAAKFCPVRWKAVNKYVLLFARFRLGLSSCYSVTKQILLFLENILIFMIVKRVLGFFTCYLRTKPLEYELSFRMVVTLRCQISSIGKLMQGKWSCPNTEHCATRIRQLVFPIALSSACNRMNQH